MVTDSSTKSGDKAYIRIKVIAGGERREEAGHLCILHLLIHQGIGHTHTHVGWKVNWVWHGLKCRVATKVFVKACIEWALFSIIIIAVGEWGAHSR